MQTDELHGCERCEMTTPGRDRSNSSQRSFTTMTNKRKCMNKLKKLFSPSALSATVATGLLVTSGINAWATCNTTSAVWQNNPNCFGTTCGQQTCTQRFGGRTYYWC